MIIQKIGHSCILLEKDGKKLIIDPGVWAFAPIGAAEPEEIGSVDVVLYTHEHADHFDPAILKRIIAHRMSRIVSHSRIQELLAKEEVACEVIAAGSEIEIEGFRIRGVKADHEDLIVPKPPNMGFLINDIFFHPGDSLTFGQVACKIFAMPFAGPWMRLKEAVEMAKALKPKAVIPIHDAYVKDFFLDRMQGMVKNYLNEKGIEVILDKLEY